ncbi:hypothetical protein [Tepidibacter hydrothermalis]|uniref:Uncharacterized protein n=1 Tax=Tepidibacter hydrothermalis TaxID=3036126 RepID=A0ABY8EGK6_9FIRM|nr:hypothetical protein [Tepidibacter hydrothermalis]WFD10990.1 hypothetical protein P4S50_02635 [Tepidibacter hydrothermalis]
MIFEKLWEKYISKIDFEKYKNELVNYKNILFEYINKRLIKFREISLNGNIIGDRAVSIKLYHELKYKNNILFEQGRDYLLYTIKDKGLNDWNYNIFSIKYNLNIDNKIADCITIVFNKNNNLDIESILNLSQKFLPHDSIAISSINKEYIKFDLNDKGEKIKYNIKYESKKLRKNTGKSEISLEIYKIVEPLLYSDEVREQFIRVKISN